MTDPLIAPREPCLADLPAGDYEWRGRPFTVKTRAPGQTRTVWLCGCERSRTPPFCDGRSHNLPPP